MMVTFVITIHWIGNSLRHKCQLQLLAAAVLIRKRYPHMSTISKEDLLIAIVNLMTHEGTGASTYDLIY